MASRKQNLEHIKCFTGIL